MIRVRRPEPCADGDSIVCFSIPTRVIAKSRRKYLPVLAAARISSCDGRVDDDVNARNGIRAAPLLIGFVRCLLVKRTPLSQISMNRANLSPTLWHGSAIVCVSRHDGTGHFHKYVFSVSV